MPGAFAVRRVLVSLWILSAACAPALRLPQTERSRIVDLTHSFDDRAIAWPTNRDFELEAVHDGPTEAGYHYASNDLRFAEHTGTHIDAPYHFSRVGRTVDAIPVEQLIGPGVRVDVTDAVAVDRDYQVRTDDLLLWEREHGRLPVGAIVLLHTGFGRRWPDRGSYMGTAERGPDAVARLHFPGLHPEAARWLVRERHVRAVGLDTPSIDHGPSGEFPTHVVLAKAQVPAFENVAHLDRLPMRGFTVIALPMKIGGGSGGPLRIVAMLAR